MLPRSTPDLIDLDLFLSVIELGSLSKAAASHGIAQPSASARVRSLEARLGLRLLDRSPTGSVPTQSGSLVAGWARTVLQAAEELNAGVEALQARRAGRLRVGASFTIAEYLLPGWLEQFLRNRPDDSVRLTVENSAAVLDQLRHNEIDLGFIESPGENPDMEAMGLSSDELITVVGRGHAWARTRRVPIEALASTQLVVRERGSGTREALEATLAALGYDPPPSALELGSTAAVRAAVLNGQWPAVMSRLAVRADIEAGSLVAVDVDGLTVERTLRAVWPTGADLSPLAQSFLDQLR